MLLHFRIPPPPTIPLRVRVRAMAKLSAAWVINNKNAIWYAIICYCAFWPQILWNISIATVFWLVWVTSRCPCSYIDWHCPLFEFRSGSKGNGNTETKASKLLFPVLLFMEESFICSWLATLFRQQAKNQHQSFTSCCSWLHKYILSKC